MTADCAVAVVGAGNMGGAMVARLCHLNWSVAVHDCHPVAHAQAVARGAMSCDSAAQATQRLVADGVLLVAVVNAEQTETVLWGAGGAASHLKPGHTVMLCPTLGPDTVHAQAQRLSALGVDCMDAPMSGGPARAEAGTMSLMVACPADVRQRHEALLKALSQQVFWVGPRPGDGARTKLVNNLLAAVNLAGAVEAMALAERWGLNSAITLDVIEASSGQSWIGSDRMRRALAEDWVPRAHVSLLAKDTHLAVASAEAAGFDAALGRLARDVFAQALVQGFSDLDDAALLQWMRQH